MMDDELRQRVLALERENRRMRWCGLTCLLGVLCAALFVETGSAQNPPDVLRARSLQIVDRAGKTRAEIAIESDGRPTFSLLGEDGKMYLGIGMLSGRGNPVITMWTHEQLRASMGVLQDDKPYFRAWEENKVIWQAP